MISDICNTMNRSREAISAASDAQSLFQEVSDSRGEASAKVLEAFAHSGEGDNDKCIAVATDAQDIYEEEGDTEGAGLALRLIAEIALEDKDFEKAMQAAQRRKELWEETSNKLEIAISMHLIAIVHISSDDPEQGYEVASDALKIAQELGNKRLEAIISLELVAAQVCIMSRAGNPDSTEFTDALKQALDAATKAVNLSSKYCTKSFDRPLRARAVTWKAQLLHNCSQPGQSLKLAVYAEKLWRAVLDEVSVVEALVLQAHAKFTMKDKEGALEIANQAMELAKEIGSSEMEAACTAAIDRITYVAPVAAPQIPQEYLSLMQGGGEVAQDAAAPAAAQSIAKAAPTGLDPEMTKTKLMRLVKDLLAGDADDFENDSPFMEAGMDSLSSVQMMTEVSKEFQMSMSPSLIFDFPTVRAMTDHLVEESKSLAEAAY
jgi:acyl carrier protein/tetratricopeptide (TPR) repeat protein